MLGEAFAVLVGILTFVLLVFADLVPKTLAAKYSVPVVLNMAYPAYGAAGAHADHVLCCAP